jgi:wyosine [tRNA(Phe)-imidazoG37] synthetase (radical SAM superfamily)
MRILARCVRAVKARVRRHVYPYAPAVIRRHYESYRFGARYQRPNTLYIETTSACNLNCVMCAAQRPSTKSVKPSGFIDVGLFERLVDETVRELPSIQWIYLHKDGEPLLHPRIVELIEYASSRHANVTLVTNATLLDETMAHAILSTPLQNIRFSVDGFTKSTFERVRIQRADNEFATLPVSVGFDAVMENIGRFLELKRRSGNKTLRVGLRTTDFKATAAEIKQYVDYWSARVDFVDVAGLSSWSGEVGKEQASEREPCMAPWASLVVGWNGRLVPCCTYIDTQGTRKGDLFDAASGSLLEALQANGRRSLMLAQLENNLASEAPYCVDCRDWRAIPLPQTGRKRVLAKLRSVAEPPA